MLGSLLTIIIIIWIISYLMKATNNNSFSKVQADNQALEILKQRYAKGEISEEEYLRVRRNIQ